MTNRLKISSAQLIDLYLNKKLSTHKIAKMYGVTPQLIRYYLIKNKIRLRKPKSKQKVKYKISKRKLEELYLKKRLSLDKICKLLKIRSRTTITLKLMRYGIPIRTISEAKTKYPKRNFSQNPQEKAYLLGFRTGDLTAYRNGNLIRVNTASTHLAQLEVIKKIFGKYTRVKTYPFKNQNGTKELSIYCDLNQSFKFLLDKLDRIPDEIMENPKLFYSFLAGYSDAEGSWDIFKNTDNTVTFHFRIATSDKIILKQISDKLEKMGYHCKFSLFARKGKKATFGKYKKNLYAVRIWRKKDVIRLASIILPLSYHKEKIKRMRFILKHQNVRKWTDIEEKVNLLRAEIRNSRIKFI